MLRHSAETFARHPAIARIRVVIHGDDFDTACEHALRLAEENGRIFVHPYDDPEVITGQATIAMELFRQVPAPPDYLFVCVGGGGMAAGMEFLAYLNDLIEARRNDPTADLTSALVHAEEEGDSLSHIEMLAMMGLFAVIATAGDDRDKTRAVFAHAFCQ